MKTLRHLLPLALLAAAAQFAHAAVPSTINYQGRLTNAAGVPQSGSKAMSLNIYDAATSGTLLYAETVGSVAVDTNGVYGFQFGAAGNSSTLVTETLATTDGTSLTYTKALSNTPVVAGIASVTDGTYNWNETTGNPGSRATATATIISGFVIGGAVTSGGSGYSVAPAVTITGNGTGAAATATVSSGAVSAINITSAGSGYTTGATITIAAPPAPFTVNYTGVTVTATYASAPAAGQSITATYRYSAGGISGALAAGAEQWLELTVDGAAQSPRQKVLAVPFAMNAASANYASTANTASTANIATLAVRATSASSVDPRLGVKYAVSQLHSPPDSGGSILISMPTTYRCGDGAQPNSKGNGCVFDIPKNAKTIQNVSCSTYNQSLANLNGYSGVTNGFSTVSLRTRSGNGTEMILATQTVSGHDQSITLTGPFSLDFSLYEYFVRVDMGASTTGSIIDCPYSQMASISNLSVTLDLY